MNWVGSQGNKGSAMSDTPLEVKQDVGKRLLSLAGSKESRCFTTLRGMLASLQGLGNK